MSVNQINNLDAVSDVVLEEYGHFVDSQLNVDDAPGDEGDIFAAVIRDEKLSPSILERLRDEDDITTINWEGKSLLIEQANSGHNIETLINSLDSLFADLENALGGKSALKPTNGSVFDTNLPILGDVLGGLQNTTSIISEIRGAIANVFQPGLILTADEIAQKLSEIPYLNVTKISEGVDSAEFALDLSGVVNLANIDIASDLGLLDEFNLDIDGKTTVDLTYDLKGLRFGVNQSEAYLRKDDSDLDINVNIDLPDLFQGKLGCIPLEFDTALPDIDFDFSVDLGSFNHSLDFSQLTDISLFEFDFELPDGTIDLPGISGDLKLNFGQLGDLDFSNPNLDDYNIPFSFDDIKLDLGTLFNDFLEPALGKIDDIFAPVRPLIEILDTEIPIVNELADNSLLDINADGRITFRDLAEWEAFRQGIDVDFGLIDNILEFSNFIASVPDTGEIIGLGDINIDNLGNIASVPLEVTNPSLDLPSGFNFPLYEDPFNFAYNLILGKPTEVFTYRTPSLKFDLNPGVFVPIIGPLGVRVGGNFGAQAQFGFGFDTYGLTCGDEHHAFEDGFYVNDTANLDGTGEDIPEAILTAGLSIDGGVDLELAKAFLGLDVNGQTFINLNDPSPEDGKIRFNEIPFDDPSNIFDPIALDSIFLQQSAWFQVGIPGLSYRQDIPLSPQIPLYNEDLQKEYQNLIDEIEKFSDLAGRGLNDFSESLAEAEKEVREWAEDRGGEISEGWKDFQDWGQDRIDVAQAEGQKIIDKVNGGLVWFDEQVTQKIYEGLGLNYIFDPIVKGLGLKTLGEYYSDSGIADALSSISAAIDGDTEERKVNVPTRKTFTVEQNGSELNINWNSDLSNDYLGKSNIELVIEVINGQLIVKAPQFEREELVATKHKAVITISHQGWKKNDDIYQTIRHSNTWRVPVSDVNKITIEGTDLDDRIYTTENVSIPIVVNAKGGHDLIQGGSGDDTLKGQAGNDTLLGFVGNDVLEGNEGDDLIFGGKGQDTLDGGADQDLINGEEQSDTLYGGSGNDTLVGESDTLPGEQSGDDYIQGNSGKDRIVGAKGNDILDGGDGEDTIDGGGGNDYLSGGKDNDTLIGGENDDEVDGNEGNDDIRGDNDDGSGEGNDELRGGSGDDLIQGGAGDDIIDGESGADFLEGEAGVDNITGGSDDDPNDGNDFINGGDGNDVLKGGNSNASGAVFRGNNDLEPADVLLGEAGDDELYGEGGADYLNAGTGIDFIDGGRGDDTLRAEDGGDDFVDRWGNNQFVGLSDTAVPTGSKVSSISEETNSQNEILGTISSDEIVGGRGKETVYGFAGNDRVSTKENNDEIWGGSGNDSLKGDEGNDIIHGGIDNDSIEGGADDDELYGDDGRDIIFGNDGQDTLSGEAGEDTLSGGLGNDTLKGGEESDRLAGDGGNDQLYGDAGDDTLEGGTEDDTLSGGIGNDTLSGDEGDDSLEGNAGIDTLSGGLGNDTLKGGEQSDRLSGDGGNDQLYGEAGDDTLEGGTEDDILIGDLGNDSLSGDEGQDSLEGNAGEDTLRGGLGNDTLKGGEQSDRLTGDGGNDELYGDAGDDTLEGGTEDDDLFGGLGNDTLTGDEGEDSLEGNAGLDTLDGGLGNDTLRGGEESDRLSGDGGNDELYGDAGDDTLEGGTEDDDLFGGTGNDSLSGDEGEDSLEGNAGLDTLRGGSGNDTLKGGDEDDLIEGGAGADSIEGGTGKDTATYISSDAGVSVDLATGQGSLAHAEGDRLASIETLVGSTFGDTLQGSIVNERFEGKAGDDFIDGRGGSDTVLGEQGNDTIHGGTGNDTLEGNADNDFLYGEDGIDTLEGGTGDDSLEGNADNDFLYGEDGIDTLEGGTGDDSLEGNADNDFLYGEEGIDTLRGGTGDDSLEGNADNDFLYGEDGKDILKGQAGADVLRGGKGNDTLEGGLENDTLEGNEHDDHLYGQAGEDAIDAGSGNDYIEGGTENDTIYGRLGNDTLYGNEGNDYLEAGDSNDSLYGASNDSIFGGSGDDTLKPGWGDDVVDGGEGTDTLAIDYSTLPTAAVIWGARDPEDDSQGLFASNAYGMNAPIVNFDDVINGRRAAISADGTTVAFSKGIRKFVQKLEGDDEPIDIGNIGSYSSSLSEDGSKVVVSFGSKLYVGNSDGTNLIEIADRKEELQKLAEIFGVEGIANNSGGLFQNPVISGDGSKIVWELSVSYDTDYSYIGVANSDGTGEIQRITGVEGAIVSKPFISGDGSKIAWVKGDYFNVAMVANSDLSDIKQISVDSTDGYNKDEVGAVSLSADGSQIAWSQSGYENYQDFDKIFIASTDSDPIERIDIADIYNINKFHLSFSPDGDQISFVQELQDGSNNYGLYVVNTDGTGKPALIASGGFYDLTNYRQGLSSYVDIGVRYGNFDVATGSGEILTWGPSHVNFSNVEKFDLKGTIYGDELKGGNLNDTLQGNGGADTLQGGDGDDTYLLDADTAAGSHIEDTAGDDTLILDNLSLSLQLPTVGTAGIHRENYNLNIDLDRDGIIHPNNDLTIVDFFADTSGTAAGTGFVETVANLSGDEILTTLSNEGNDLIETGNGQGELYGGLGNDTLQGNDGDDTLYGEAGSDTLKPDWGDDVVDGGEGTDTLAIDYSTLPTAAIIWNGIDSEGYSNLLASNAYGMNTPLVNFGRSNNISAISADGTTVAWDGYTESNGNGGYIQKLEGDNQPLHLGWYNSNISLSADGSKITYLNGGDLYVSNADGSDAIQLFDYDEEREYAAQTLGVDENNVYSRIQSHTISADGSKVVWEIAWENQSDSSYSSSIVVADTDGTGLIRSPLHYGEYDDEVSNPSISGDGSKIAWIQDNELRISNSDFSQIETLDFVSGIDVYSSFSLSEDGSTIAWHDGGVNEVGRIWVAPVDGSRDDRVDVSGFTGIDSTIVSLSPDGERVSYIKRLGDGSNNYGLFVANTDGTGEPTLVASGDYQLKNYRQGLSEYVDIGVRYGDFDVATGSGEILTWGPSHVNFSNVEKFDLKGTIYGDELKGGNLNDTLQGNGGADTLQGGLGDDTYLLDADTAAGSHIEDTAGDDTLILDNLSLSLQLPTVGTAGIHRENYNLNIDLNQDGIIHPDDDLTIIDFFADTSGTAAGTGFIDTVANLPGSEILTTLSNEGNDLIETGNGQGELYGGLGNDTLQGSNGNDTLNGEAGTDLLKPDWGEDIVDGGEGTDTLAIDYSTLPTAAVLWRNEEDGNNKIFAGNAYGMNVPKLNFGNTNGTANISADGTTVAWDKYIQQLEGDNQPLEIFNVASSSSNISLSADGSKIAYKNSGDLYVSNADGSNAIQLFDYDEEREYAAQSLGVNKDSVSSSIESHMISADGSKVVGQLVWENQSDSSHSSSIVVVNSNGTGLIRSPLYQGDYSDGIYDPFISGDGSKIAWIQDEELRISNSDFSQIETLDFVSGLDRSNSFSLSEDGSTIAWHDQNAGRIWVAPVDGSRDDRVDVSGFIGTASTIVSLSPDGERVSYRARLQDGSNNYGLFVANTDGTGEPVLIASGDYQLKNYRQGLSEYVDIGVRYGDFDVATGSGEILTWGPSHVNFSNVEKFDLKGTIYGDELKGGNLNDTLKGRGGDDTLKGGDGSDTLEGGNGHDTLEGGIGDDNLQGWSGQDSLNGGAGNDLLVGHADDDILDGAAGNDELYSGGGHDTLNGQAGADILWGWTGDDVLNGGDGEDKLIGHDDNDLINGGNDNDFLAGVRGDDTLNGDGGNDKIWGWDGNDVITGGEGRDILIGHLGNDRLNGGEDNDFLSGDIGNDTLNGGSGNDNLRGWTGDDLIEGDLGKDLLVGHAGNDSLTGGEGDDSLYGGDGSDVLEGSAGNDVLFGNGGIDIFVVKLELGRDFLADFVDGVDKFGLRNGLTFEDLEIVQSGNNSLIKDSANNQLALVNGIAAADITADDFSNI